jgi:hypothetical protein
MLPLAVKTSPGAIGKGKREKELEKEKERKGKRGTEVQSVVCVYVCFVKSESLSRNDIQERK